MASSARPIDGFVRLLVGAGCATSLLAGPVHAQTAGKPGGARPEPASAAVATPPPAASAAPPVAASPQARAAARDAYGRGQTAFAQGNYAEAKSAFEQAYVLLPNPLVLLGTAECDIRLGNIEQAHMQLQRYLNERPDAPNRVEVERKAAELRAKPALLMLTSEPRGAVITIDGKDLGAQTPAEVFVAPGERHVVLAHPGYEPASEVVQARMGARHGLRLILRASPASTSTKPPAAAAVAAAATGPGTAFWVAGIIGSVGLATGVVLGVLALDEEGQFNRQPSVASADRGERLALFADVAFAVSAAALITTAVLYTAGEDGGGTAHGAGEHAVRLSPTLLRGGAGLATSARF